MSAISVNGRSANGEEQYSSPFVQPEMHLAMPSPACLGFTLEGVEREGELMADGQYVDLNVYSILKREIENW